VIAGLVPAFSFTQAVQTALIDGMTALTNIETRIKADSGNINHQGIGIEVIHDTYMSFAKGEISTEAAAQAMAESIKTVMDTQTLMEAEIAGLTNVLTEIVGDAGLAAKYVGQLADVDTNGGKVSAMVDESNPDIIIEQEADKPVENPTTIDYNLVKEYVRDIEERTGIKLHKKQIEELKNALRNKEYTRLSTLESSQHRDIFKKVKNDLIVEWEKNTGRKWPRYKDNIISKRGRIIRFEGDKYDAHHIIESSFGGDNEWWNIHPARFPDAHQAGIHATSSPASRLFIGGDL
jgi:predicted ribonuclease toxin of YeeF-YezG toxin-antitoxin module